MRLGDIFSVTQNKKNKQHIASFKKKLMKELDISIDDVLGVKLKMRGKRIRF